MRRLPRSKRGLQNHRRHGIASAHFMCPLEAKGCRHRPVTIPIVAVTTPSVTPAMTPDQKFVQDMNDKFAEEMNPGKNPISDFWDYRLFTDDIAVTGHDICGYLGSHS